MIVVTGGAGFIGSCTLSYLRKKGAGPLVAVDHFEPAEKQKNWQGIDRLLTVERDNFFPWLKKSKSKIEFVFHLGARTDTAETDRAIFQKWNVDYSKEVWKFCAEESIPLVYASSAATYGNGENGFSDDHQLIKNLQPLNAYGQSKQDFDLWALKQKKSPPQWYGLKFFNVYGPNEYHKGRMSSMVYQAYHQIENTGKLKLFKSHKDGVEHGQQKRDFIYVGDLLSVLFFLYTREPENGIYNVGTGKAQSFLTLAESVFKTAKRKMEVEFIDIPEDIRSNYQYFTEADISKLRAAGYVNPFKSIEEGVREYLRDYLISGNYY
nr:ADP-glyceromanno-heptose 6-epimerase [Saprospiraceae bacterium]